MILMTSQVPPIQHYRGAEGKTRQRGQRVMKSMGPIETYKDAVDDVEQARKVRLSAMFRHLSELSNRDANEPSREQRLLE